MLFHEPFGGVIPGARGVVLEILLRTGEALTGRQIHGMVSDRYSLWSVQEALKALNQLGLVETQTVGRAGVHTINEQHVFVAPLRELVDPIALLISTVREVVDAPVHSVVLFGSVARGDSGTDSDIDLAVISSSPWDRRPELQELVSARLGNECDVVLFTDEEFHERVEGSEPVVHDILRDGIALIGTKPRAKRPVAG